MPTKTHEKAMYDVVDGRYGRLTVFANDTGAVTQSLLTYGEWAENEISFLQRFTTRGCTVLDIGAYIGTHTLAFARFVGPEGRVIAVEAQPNSFKVLEKNVAGNVAVGSSSVVQIENAIVTSQLGQVTIPTIDIERESSFGSASLLPNLTAAPPALVISDGVMSNHVSVRAITIDSLALQNCALIKVDVEGVEDTVLRGAVQTLDRCSPYVYCECNTLAAGLKSIAVLEGVGYEVFAHVVNAFNPNNFFHVEENIFGTVREVALVGVPLDQAVNIRSLAVRPFELLLEIKNADDLALALLNKPQYQSEVLRLCQAAKTGGIEFLNRYEASRLELHQLQNENVALQSLLAEERNAFEQRIQSSGEEHSALQEARNSEAAQLHVLLTQRDVDIVQLQAQVNGRDREISELHALLTQRDADISRLQAQVEHSES